MDLILWDEVSNNYQKEGVITVILAIESLFEKAEIPKSITKCSVAEKKRIP